MEACMPSRPKSCAFDDFARHRLRRSRSTFELNARRWNALSSTRCRISRPLVPIFCYRCYMQIRFVSFLSLSIFSTVSIFAQQTPQSLADAGLPSLLAIYKDIHTHPELSGHEERTAALVAKELRAAGCDVTENFGKYDKPNLKCYGVIGVMKNGEGTTVQIGRA